MNVIVGYPPNIEKIRRVFGYLYNVVYTYGETIYSPQGSYIEDHLAIHEQTHMLQQGEDPEGWWDKYLSDTHFRLEQEIEAYRNQHKFYKKKYRNWMPFTVKIAKDLSGNIYGNIISYKEALNKIIT